MVFVVENCGRIGSLALCQETQIGPGCNNVIGPILQVSVSSNNQMIVNVLNGAFHIPIIPKNLYPLYF